MICERTRVEPTLPKTNDAGWNFLTLSEEPPPRRAVRPKKQTRRRKNAFLRRLETLLMSIAVLAAVAALGSSTISWWNATGRLTAPSASYATVTVAKGDTLWTIAQRNGGPSQFVADELERIRAANPNLHQGQQLVPGQTLLVPVAGAVTTDQLHLAQASPSHRAF